MIATITLNPSVDICYYMEEFNDRDINRCNNYIKTAGGKGINVSKVLKKLGCEIIATGFLGGYTGGFIEEELKKMGIIPQFIKIEEDTRNCIAIITEEAHSEILESGPSIHAEESESFLQLFSGILDNYPIAVVAASGSIPESLSTDYYNRLIAIAKKRNVKFVLDTSNSYLKKAVSLSPYLIKPNIFELENFLDRSIQSEKELIAALDRLKAYNIEMVVISLGKEGCMALCENTIYKVTIPSVNMKSAVGSGDAMVAGMVSEIERNSSYEEILRVGNTCGVLNAIDERTGHIDISLFEDIYGKVRVKMIRS